MFLTFISVYRLRCDVGPPQEKVISIIITIIALTNEKKEERQKFYLMEKFIITFSFIFYFFIHLHHPRKNFSSFCISKRAKKKGKRKEFVDDKENIITLAQKSFRPWTYRLLTFLFFVCQAFEREIKLQVLRKHRYFLFCCAIRNLFDEYKNGINVNTAKK